VVSSSRLAKVLDQEMIERNGGSIAPATTLDRDLPPRPGMAIADEIGGRLLIRYMLRRQLGMFLKGSTDRHFVPDGFPEQALVLTSGEIEVT
jgi:hypothetical protein